MFTIGRNDSISLLKHRNHADGDGLLAIIEMEKASDLLLRIELGTFVLEPTNADHLFQEIELMRAGQMWFVALIAPRFRASRDHPAADPARALFKSRA